MIIPISRIPFLLKKEEPPVCVTCNATITIKHILTECADLVAVRKESLEESSLYSLFRNVNQKTFLDYPKEICLLLPQKSLSQFNHLQGSGAHRPLQLDKTF